MGEFGKLTWVPATCCRKGYFHRECIGNRASKEDFRFKCPMCGDATNDKLFAEVKKRCIFLPNETHDDAKHRPEVLCLYCNSSISVDDQSAFGPCCSHWFHQKCLDFDKCPLCTKLIPGSQTAVATKFEEELPQQTKEENSDSNSVSTHGAEDEDGDKGSLSDAATEIFEYSSDCDVKPDIPISPITAINTNNKRKPDTESLQSNKRLKTMNEYNPASSNSAISDFSNNSQLNHRAPKTAELINKMEILKEQMKIITQMFNNCQAAMQHIAVLCEEIKTED
jgi:hypothetical protein